MSLTNRMITEFRNLGFGLYEQFELSFLGILYLEHLGHTSCLTVRLLFKNLPGEAIREVAVVDLEGRF